MLVMDRQEYLTSEEVAQKLRIEHETVTRWLRTCALPGYKFGKQWRVRPDDLEKFVRERRNVGSPPDASPDTEKFHIMRLPSYGEE